VDAALPNFHEKFITNSVQPYAEFEYHATRQLTLTGGFKYAYYKQSLTQFADNGKTVGNLGGQPSVKDYGFAVLEAETTRLGIRIINAD
jgi:iron complex outermembrane receptor protein